MLLEGSENSPKSTNDSAVLVKKSLIRVKEPNSDSKFNVFKYGDMACFDPIHKKTSSTSNSSSAVVITEIEKSGSQVAADESSEN